MCKKCGIIIVKNRANQHDKRVHKLDVARYAWARADEVYLNKIAVDPRRAFWSETLMPGHKLDDIWDGKAEDLVKPFDL